MSAISDINPAVLEAAATWYVDLQNAPDALLQAAHQQWLEAAPAHRQAWARVEKLQQAFAATPQNATSATLNQARTSRRQAIKMLSVLLVCGAGSTLVWQQKSHLQVTTKSWLAEHRTVTGEHREITLPDNSLLHLNTATAVDVRFSDSQRDIQLYEGEIEITTGSDELQRPFVVHTPEGSIRALGTRFTVHSENGQTHVGVTKHAVAIQPQQISGQSIRLESGQQLRFTPSTLSPSKPLNDNSNAWTKGLLIVSDWRLGDFLTELSRYRPGKISYDPAVTNLRISGAFHLSNTDTVLENLAATLPISVRFLTRYWVRVGSE